MAPHYHGGVARAALRLAENAPGEVYVDSTCIDCETCRAVAPETFSRDARAGQSVVSRQPQGPAELRRALMALVSCPTASIGTVSKQDVSAAAAALPEEIHPGSGVYYCGYAAESSFGASSWLIRRPGGNVLVDSPRAARPLLARLDELGGVRTLFLSHRDDVADQAKLRTRFGCERVLHADDVAHGTQDVEVKLQGRDPVRLADDLIAIPVPGHTRGSCALLYKDEFLFTGDHLWGDEDTGRLGAGRGVCWYSWPEQTRSMEKLLDFRFTWVLPGHGRLWRAPSPEAMREELRHLLASMRS
jgi:glyoxylase-like metal-dependent hydrolase (beta-lactamase superfamily II)/ferredoxin